MACCEILNQYVGMLHQGYRDPVGRMNCTFAASQRLMVLPQHLLQTYSQWAVSVAGLELIADNLRDLSVSRDSRLLKTQCI